jgi:E3 ubiquitin-protein ligase HUWE1
MHMEASKWLYTLSIPFCRRTSAPHELPQTLLITSRDRKDTDPDYFEAHNFLVQLRLAALPLLKDLWEAGWLVPAPLPVVKSVMQAVMKLTGDENEEPKGDAAGEVLVWGPSPTSAARSAGPDENCIRQVTDMGFPQSPAEHTLARTHNNVSAPEIGQNQAGRQGGGRKTKLP